MKKKIIAFAGMAALTICVATSAFTVPAFAASYAPAGPGAGYGFCGGGYNLMRDQNGNFLDKGAFEARLDEMVENGFISPESRGYFIDRYDWCVTYGRDAGIRGGGRGMGCGMGRGW